MQPIIQGHRQESVLRYHHPIRNPKEINSVQALPKLDVIIPVFDPGLPEDLEDYEDENIWPEIRRAEANRFAYKLKEKLDETGQFGSQSV